VFGQMFEDHAVDVAALPVGRIMSVASAGDTAFALAARGSLVTAVDTSRAQLQYVEQRLFGGAVLPGSADRLLGVGRAVLRHTGWRRADLEAFCDLDDVAEQAETWRSQIDTPGFRRVLATVLSRAPVRSSGFAPFTGVVQSRLDQVMHARLADGIARHRNRGNPFLRRLLTGTPVPTPVPSAAAVRLVHADVLAHLQSVPEGHYDGFSLSNILDGADRAYATRLRAAVRRAAAPGAVAVHRSFASTDDEEAGRAARADRSLLWGSLYVEQVGR
jgi:S-adenosylmethionine:diacylglycerol 3-amino-3-carboxypropyl transferase